MSDRDASWCAEVDEDGAGQRADVVVAKALKISRRAAQRLCDDGSVRVDGHRVRKGDPLRAGARLEISPPAPPLVADAGVDLPVVHVDPALIVVDKPAGMPTHPLEPGERGTAANALVARFPELGHVGPEREGGAGHRLDAGTSGLLCFARTPAAYTALRAAFGSGRVTKEYLALCLGTPPARGQCTGAIGRSRPGAPRAQVFDDPLRAQRHSALPAQTRFEVQQRFRGCALVRVEARTGRSHQVRVHLAHLGFPLCGDSLYQDPAARAADPTGLEHPFLHASGLELPHPATGEILRLRSELPARLRELLAGLAQGWRA